MRRLGLIGGGAFAVIALLAFAYPTIIGRIYSSDLPLGWTDKLTGITLAEIQQQIGPPQEESNVKGFQHWIVRHWWGIQLLKIVSKNCQLQEKPIAVVYFVYVDGRYNPVVTKTLGEAP